MPTTRQEYEDIENMFANIDDEEEIVPQCDLENPESCESCQ